MRRLLTFCALVVAAALTLVSPATAQQDPGYPDVPPTEIEEDEVVPPPGTPDDSDDDDEQVLGDGTGESLPVTGGDVVGLAAIGAAAIGIGVVLVAWRRQAD